MIKKILIATFFTAIMLMVPFTTVAHQSSITNEESKEKQTSSIQSNIDAYNTISANKATKITIEKLTSYNGDVPNFKQIQKNIKKQLIYPANNENASFCAMILFLMVVLVALTLKKTIKAIMDWIDEEGELSFINALKSGTFGVLVALLAVVFTENCLATIEGKTDLTETSGSCNCIKN